MSAGQYSFSDTAAGQPSRPPNKINRDEPVKMMGHSLKAIKVFLKPVNIDTNDNVLSSPKASQYTDFETGFE